MAGSTGCGAAIRRFGQRQLWAESVRQNPLALAKTFSLLSPLVLALRRALAILCLTVFHAYAPEHVQLSRSNTVFHVRPPNARMARLGLQPVPVQNDVSPFAPSGAAQRSAQFER